MHMNDCFLCLIYRQLVSVGRLMFDREVQRCIHICAQAHSYTRHLYMFKFESYPTLI